MEQKTIQIKKCWTPELKKTKALLNTLERKARNIQKVSDREAHRKASRNCTATIQKAKAEQREKELSKIKESAIWKIVYAGKRKYTTISTIQGEEMFAGK